MTKRLASEDACSNGPGLEMDPTAAAAVEIESPSVGGGGGGASVVVASGGGGGGAAAAADFGSC